MKTIPRIGLGTWKSSDKSLTDAVRYAIKECGYCHIDCAHVYQNEALIGEVLEELFKSGIKRENLWITSKLWCTHHHPDMVEKACRNTLKDLRIDYIDLYLIHIPLAFKKQDVGGELFVKDDRETFCLTMFQLLIPGRQWSCLWIRVCASTLEFLILQSIT